MVNTQAARRTWRLAFSWKKDRKSNSDYTPVSVKRNLAKDYL